MSQILRISISHFRLLELIDTKYVTVSLKSNNDYKIFQCVEINNTQIKTLNFKIPNKFDPIKFICYCEKNRLIGSFNLNYNNLNEMIKFHSNEIIFNRNNLNTASAIIYITKEDKPIRILSIDGGGIRGIISLEILIELERKFRQKKPNTKLKNYFDLICGTSSGGLIAFTLSLTNLSLKQIQKIYFNSVNTIFSGQNCFQNLKTKFSFICNSSNPKYYGRKFKKELEKYFGVKKLSDFHNNHPKAFVVTTKCDYEVPSLFLFRSYSINSKKREFCINGTDCQNNEQITALDSVYATCAAPTFYCPLILPKLGTFADGGMLANNPTELAIVESNDIWPNKKISLIVSIGTGRKNPEKLFKGKRTNLKWIYTILNIITESESVSNRINWLCKELSKNKNSDLPDYYRVNTPPNMNMGSIKIDSTNKKLLVKMRRDTKKWIKTDQIVQRQLKKIVDKTFD